MNRPSMEIELDKLLKQLSEEQQAYVGVLSNSPRTTDYFFKCMRHYALDYGYSIDHARQLLRKGPVTVRFLTVSAHDMYNAAGLQFSHLISRAYGIDQQVRDYLTPHIRVKYDDTYKLKPGWYEIS